MMDLPTIGLAKRLIAGTPADENLIKTDFKPIFLENKVAGAFINGYYVSIGHKITLSTAIELFKNTSIYKTPEPIRQAHILATKTFKKIIK